MELNAVNRSIIDYVTIYDERFVSTEYGIDELSLTNQSNPNWYRYRLGDMVRWEKKAKNEEWGYQYHKHQFPQSIATQYLSYKFEDLNGTLYLNRDAKFKDYRLLLQIVRNRTINSSATALINSIDYDHTLIVHLRTGDVIDNSKLNVNDILNSSGSFYHRSRSYYIIIYIRAINGYKNHGLRKALFMTGWHRESNHKKSILYIKEIIRLFELNGYATTKNIVSTLGMAL
eukprot:649998_1